MGIHPATQQCYNFKANLASCSCTYHGCSRKGLCCQCVAYHRASGEIPGCFFPPNAEKTYDRSIARFLRTVR